MVPLAHLGALVETLVNVPALAERHANMLPPAVGDPTASPPVAEVMAATKNAIFVRVCKSSPNMNVCVGLTLIENVSNRKHLVVCFVRF